MASLDDIFKSDLNESKKKAKMLFGKVLIYLRKNNHIKLYAMLESVSDTDLIDNELNISMLDKTAYEMINNRNDLDLLNSIVDEIEKDTKVKLICNGKDAFDIFQFESRLKQEFGKILTIKKEN